MEKVVNLKINVTHAYLNNKTCYWEENAFQLTHRLINIIDFIKGPLHRQSTFSSNRLSTTH